MRKLLCAVAVLLILAVAIGSPLNASPGVSGPRAGADLPSGSGKALTVAVAHLCPAQPPCRQICIRFGCGFCC